MTYEKKSPSSPPEYDPYKESDHERVVRLKVMEGLFHAQRTRECLETIRQEMLELFKIYNLYSDKGRRERQWLDYCIKRDLYIELKREMRH